MACGSILLGWLFFAATHIGGSSLPLRAALIRKVGLAGFKGIYALVAVATFLPLCGVFARYKHAGDLLFIPSPSFLAASELLMLASLAILLQGLATPSPISTLSELSGRPPSARGILRLTRHPQNLAFVLFGGAHLLVNPFSADVVFFGGFVVYGIASALHQDRRLRIAGSPPMRAYLAATSALPFAAILSGRQTLSTGEYSRGALIAAFLLFLLLRSLHERLFG